MNTVKMMSLATQQGQACGQLEKACICIKAPQIPIACVCVPFDTTRHACIVATMQGLQGCTAGCGHSTEGQMQCVMLVAPKVSVHVGT